MHLIQSLSLFAKQGESLMRIIEKSDKRLPQVRVPLEQPNRKLQSAEVDELLALYESGLGLTELGALFGMHRQTVQAHLLRRGMGLRSELRVFSPEEVVELVRLYEAGSSSYQLAAKFDAQQSTVWRTLKAAGVVMRSHGGR